MVKLRIIDPSPAMVAQARERANLTQLEAANLVHLAAYQRWAEYERGVRPIDLARWELFLLVTGQHPKYQPLRAA